VTPSGDVTACPVSALATHNVRTSNLREALASPLFSMIRENAQPAETEGHPCGLSAHAEELEDMAKGLGAIPHGCPGICAIEQELASPQSPEPGRQTGKPPHLQWNRAA